MMDLSISSIGVLKEVFKAEGFNCGINLGKVAGAGIADHVHEHIVPRWMGDSNFLPVIGETRSIPEYLEDTYGKLAPLFKKV
jgi:ATP adenylyltransferase